jgi:uncharacterized membrane protein
MLALRIHAMKVPDVLSLKSLAMTKMNVPLIIVALFQDVTQYLLFVMITTLALLILVMMVANMKQWIVMIITSVPMNGAMKKLGV